MKKLYAIIAFCLLISYTPFSQTISSNAPLCGNANLTLELSATGGTSYAWKGPNSFTSTQQKPNIKNVNWKNRGVYTVIVDNKTTLTTDVNIKDPVAFTVPKEISVCEGGTLWINPDNGNLTDSTEKADHFNVFNPLGKETDFGGIGIVNNFSKNNVGKYSVSSFKGDGCETTQYINVTLNTKSDCKIIDIADLTKIQMCEGSDVIIPFQTKGNFPQGTKFYVYVYRYVYEYPFPKNQKPFAILEKSPIVLKNFSGSSADEIIQIAIIASDSENTFCVSNRRYSSTAYNRGVNGIDVNQACDNVKLSIKNPTLFNSFQWLLDGKELLGEKNIYLSANKSGSYLYRFKGAGLGGYEIDKTCLYESQPVKIELGKIEKPSAYVSNDIELCVGKPATLNVSSKANTNYRWKKDGNYIANATNTSYQTSQEGKYQIEAKEGTCTAVSDTVVLKKPERLESFINVYSNSSPIEYDFKNGNVYKLCNRLIC